MTPDSDRERRLDAILTASEGDAEALRAAARQIQWRDGDLGADLRLIAQLRETAPAKAEVDAARLRVGQRLTRDILAGVAQDGAARQPLRPLRLSEPPESATASEVGARASAPTTPAPTSPGWASKASRGSGSQRSLWRRAILTTAAAAVLFLALGGGVTAASAQSLPESPLYSAKRAEESILLAMPLSNDAHAQALGMVAQRRLAEAQAEAGERHDAEVTSLLRDYNSDMRQLIMLAASVSARGGDNSNITAQIAKVVEVEQAIMRHAAAQGQTGFSKALSASADNIAATLKQQNVTLPSANGTNGRDNGKGHGNQPNATPTVGPTPTPPGDSGSHGSGHGHGSGTDHTSNNSGG